MPEDDVPHEGRTAEFIRYWSDQRPDLDSETVALQLAIARIGLLSRKTIAHLAEAEGITGTDFSIMGVIKRGSPDGPVRPSDLWKVFSLTAGAISHRINRLFDLGLVERHAQSGDRRVILLRLTKDGEAKIDRIFTGYYVMLASKLDAVDKAPGGRRALSRLLRVLAREWENPDVDIA